MFDHEDLVINDNENSKTSCNINNTKEIATKDFKHKQSFKKNIQQKTSQTNKKYIYRIKNSLALQFHPEIKQDLFEKWYDSDLSRQELENYDVQSELNYLKENSKQLEESMYNFYNKWIAIKY